MSYNPSAFCRAQDTSKDVISGHYRYTGQTIQSHDKEDENLTSAQVTRGTYRLGGVVPAHEPEIVLPSPTGLSLVVLAEENGTAA